MLRVDATQTRAIGDVSSDKRINLFVLAPLSIMAVGMPGELPCARNRMFDALGNVLVAAFVGMGYAGRDLAIDGG